MDITKVWDVVRIRCESDLLVRCRWRCLIQLPLVKLTSRRITIHQSIKYERAISQLVLQWQLNQPSRSLHSLLGSCVICDSTPPSAPAFHHHIPLPVATRHFPLVRIISNTTINRSPVEPRFSIPTRFDTILHSKPTHDSAEQHRWYRRLNRAGRGRSMV